MKLVFTKLETDATEIKVTFDGVNYKSYNVDKLRDIGYIQFTEKDCPDLTKVKIQGKFSTFNSIEVNKTIELEPGEGGESGISCTFEKDVFEEKEVTYYCFVYDSDSSGEIDDKDDIPQYYHIWLKGEISENAEPFISEFAGIPNSARYLESAWTYDPDTKVWFVDENTIGLIYDPDNPSDDSGERLIRYPEGDLVETEKVKTGTENVTEVITEIQSNVPIKKSGLIIADEGKAFKSVSLPEDCLIAHIKNLSNISESAYEINNDLLSIVIPKSVITIDERAFCGCENLEDVTLPENLMAIDRMAFAFCNKIKNIDLPSSLKIIGDYAFDGCESIEHIVIPEGVTSIGLGAFHRCLSLKTVVIPTTVTSVENIFRESFDVVVNYRGTKEQWDNLEKDDFYEVNNTVVNFNYKSE